MLAFKKEKWSANNERKFRNLLPTPHKNDNHYDINISRFKEETQNPGWSKEYSNLLFPDPAYYNVISNHFWSSKYRDRFQ
jgi:hypothetical protein